MRPGPPRDLLLKPLSASSLRLSYDVPSQMREFPAGLVQAVTISSAHQPGVWTSLDTNISREHQKVGISRLLIILIKYQRRLSMPCYVAVFFTLYESTP